MVDTITGMEALPPDPPDQNLSSSCDVCPGQTMKQDFPALSSKPSNSKKGSRFVKQISHEKYTKFLQLDFGETPRRQVNPYAVKEELEKATGEKIKSISGSNKFKLTLHTSSAMQTEKCLVIKELAGVSCKIVPHFRFNTCKGLIFLRQCVIEDMQDFKSNLREQCDVESVEKADFIRTRPGVSAYIVTFNLEQPPYSLYIPGELSDTTVNPYIPRPMICKKCFVYGHTMKYCKSEQMRCKKCSETGHEQKDCTSTEPKCFHCSGNHEIGFKECPKHTEEQKVLEIIEKEKVSFQRARQMLNEKPVCRTATSGMPVFPTLFDVSLPKGIKRTINPWLVQKCIQQHTGKTPRRCRGKNNEDDTYVIEVSTEQESNLMHTLEKIGDHNVKVKTNNTFDLQKGLIFVQGYDCLQFEQYKQGLSKQYGLANVEHAQWIKCKNNITNALLLSFQTELPSYLDIPGETMRTFVHEYKKRPTCCQNCLEYGHPKKICRENTRCQKCTSLDHTYPPCDQEDKCMHCSQPHKTGHRTCQKYKVEEDLLAIQAKSRVSRNQAIVIYDQENPSGRTMNFADATNSTNKVDQGKQTEVVQKSPKATKPDKPKRSNNKNPLVAYEDDDEESETPSFKTPDSQQNNHKQDSKRKASSPVEKKAHSSKKLKNLKESSHESITESQRSRSRSSSQRNSDRNRDKHSGSKSPRKEEHSKSRSPRKEDKDDWDTYRRNRR